MNVIGLAIRNAWNSPMLTTWANFCVQAVNVLFIIPLIWKQWGPFELGVFLIITSINRFSYLFADRLAITFSMLVSFVDAGSTDLRPRESLVAKDSGLQASAERAERDDDVFEQVYGTLGIVLLVISIVVGMVSALIGYASITRLGQSFDVIQSDCVAAFWISMFAVVFRLNFFRFEILLQGLNKVAVLARWNAIFNFASSACCVTVAIAGYGIVIWSLVFNGFIIASCIRNVILANAVTDGQLRRFKLFRFDRDVFEAIWGPTWQGMIGHVSFVGAEQLAIVSAAFFLSPVDAISLAVYIRFLSTLGPIAQVPFTTQIPRMARMIANGELEPLRTLSLQRIGVAGLVFVLSGWGLGIALPWLPVFLKKEFTSLPIWLWGAILLMVAHDRFLILCTATMEAGNRIVLHWNRFACLIVGLLLFPKMCSLYGIAGGIMALYGTRAILLAITPVRIAADYLKMPSWMIWRKSWMPMFCVHVVIWATIVGAESMGIYPGSAKETVSKSEMNLGAVWDV